MSWSLASCSPRSLTVPSCEARRRRRMTRAPTPGFRRRPAVLSRRMLEGLHPNRPTHVMRLATDEASARQATELLGEVFDPGETAVAAFETPDGGAWALEAYFAHEP